MFTLRAVPAGVPCRVRAVHASPTRPELRQQLEDIGFHAGMPVLVMVRGRRGGGPLAVRVGESTFALRAAEAECVEVEAGGP